MLRPIRQILDAWAQLDGTPVPANFVGMKAGDEHQIKPNLFARAFPTKHSRGSLGYAIIEKRKKLKSEYADLTGPQIVELKKQSVTIDYPVEIPIVTYLGDTQFAEFSQLDYVTNSKILITECTFYEDEHIERADVGRHMHVRELAKLMRRMNNEYVIITHITHRTSLAAAKKMLRDTLDKQDVEKIIFLMDRRRAGTKVQ
jgi:ribonuclease Z